MRHFEETDLVTAYAYPERTPWLRANMVSSVDGAAWHDGRTRALGGPGDRRLLSLLRGLSDVIVVGANTVRVEGYGAVEPPAWWGDIRRGRPAAPPIAVVSRHLDLDFGSDLFASTRTIVLTCDNAPADRLREARRAADVIIVGELAVDPKAALDALTARGHVRQLTEGGPRLLAQFAAAGALDELCWTISPRLTAGDASRILNGPALPDTVRLRLGHALEQDGFLFLRYLCGPAGQDRE